MKLIRLIEELGLEVTNKEMSIQDVEITDGYASDLLSHVMANAKSGSMWLTTQGHKNIIGVASMTNIKCIVICEARNINEDVIQAADAEGILLLISEEGMFSLSGRLYERGVR